jgi:anaerobic selenocysteine-containing dehydrogenase
MEAHAPDGKPSKAAASNGVPDGRFRLVAPPVLMRGAAVERQPHLAHQRAPWVMLNHADAARLGLADGDVAVVGTPDGEHRGPVRTSRRLVEGAVRINRRGAPLPSTATATVAAAGKTG